MYLRTFIYEPERYHVISKEPMSDSERTIMDDFLLVHDNSSKIDKIINNIDYCYYGHIINWQSAYSSNFTSILKSILSQYKDGSSIIRIEKSELRQKGEYDIMTVCEYPENITIDFFYPKKENIPIELNKKIKLDKSFGFDEQDIEYYGSIREFNEMELFDLSQSNSEHSRHCFFNGEIRLNDKLMEHSLFDLVKKTILEDERFAFGENFDPDSIMIKHGIFCN